MCEPVSISMAIAGTQLVQQQMVADANNKFNKTQAETARQRANKDAAFQAEGVIRRRVEARESLAAEAVNVTREALKASGIARAGGSAGGSVPNTPPHPAPPARGYLLLAHAAPPPPANQKKKKTPPPAPPAARARGQCFLSRAVSYTSPSMFSSVSAYLLRPPIPY